MACTVAKKSDRPRGGRSLRASDTTFAYLQCSLYLAMLVDAAAAKVARYTTEWLLRELCLLAQRGPTNAD